jgi:predicted RNA binding protein with dsRBD fold (UPF0201 family)
MDQITIHIETDVNPTESEEKVKKALTNLFGELDTKTIPLQKGAQIIAQEKGLDTLSIFRNILARDKIRDSARKALREGIRDETVTFYMNKQVAFAGHVSFSESDAESPLGPIKVVIQTSDPMQLLDWLAPRTIKSRE